MALTEIHVAVAVIIREGRVLIARRPDHVHQGGLLEFPGGKVEPGETVQQALAREIQEETGLQVPLESLSPVIAVRHDYGDKRVFLDVWRTEAAIGEAEGREGQPVQWRSVAELRDEDFPAANRPIIRAIKLPSWLAITGEYRVPADILNQFQERIRMTRPELVVLRAPKLNATEYQAVARDLVMVGRDQGVEILLHGAADRLEMVPEAAGVHLPWREAGECGHRSIPADKWLGVSCHNNAEVSHAVAIGADYVTLGPVSPTPSHPGAPAMGWESFRQQVAVAQVPVYALGGLTPDDRNVATGLGAQGIAGISLWWPGI
ncbi:Nudix family hydrolase [Marinobacter sp. HN1S83]|uniref:Nudix family hydrolase n=1 Tax=Marinobacter sp. HN1S83 TaxID=3382301 RepID=UPI00387B71D6